MPGGRGQSPSPGQGPQPPNRVDLSTMLQPCLAAHTDDCDFPTK